MDHPTNHEHAMSAKKKCLFSLNGIDWKKEVMNAIEILKLNKTKMHEIAKDEKATTVGAVFIVAPQLLSLIIAVIWSGTFIGWVHGTYLLGIITPVLLVYACHFTANKFFQGKGDVWQLFRVVSYTNIIGVVSLALVLLMYIGSSDLLGIYNILSLAIGVWMLVVTYTILAEYYHLSSQNAIITLVAGIIVTGIIIALINNIIFPNPWQNLSSLRNYRY